MFGGLLVALAALATWWVAAGAGEAPAGRYVVATRAVGPGQRLSGDDVGVVTGDLPPAVRAGAFGRPHEVVGAVTLGPLDKGELVQAAALEPMPPGTARRELSFAVAADWAVAGTLRPGDRIDVFTTVGDGADAASHRVLRNAVVRAVTGADAAGLGASRDQTITVGVDDPDLVAATVTATRSATVTVVRVTGTTTGRGGR
ncbi:MAG: hypothetical protein JWM47_1450 [Acidimicrobiales bacterium]|nr:hypothetical protein [Acidimicrobiales bacterium]